MVRFFVFRELSKQNDTLKLKGMTERYEIKFTEGGVGVLETIVTGGLANVAEKAMDAISGDSNHGWYCNIKDTITEAEVNKWGSTKAEAQEAAFNALKEEIGQIEKEKEQEREKVKYQQQVRQQEQARQQQTSHSSDSDSGDGYALLGKIIGIIILVAAIVWFVFAIAIPLIAINLALIALVLGLIKRGWYKFILPLSILGSIFIVLDYNNGWFTKSLVTNVSFFQGAIPIFFYLNIIAGLVAAYFLIRNLLNEKNPQSEGEVELSKRNMIIMGCLLLAGGLTIGFQKYFDSRENKVIQSVDVLNSEIETPQTAVTNNEQSPANESEAAKVVQTTQQSQNGTFYIVCVTAVKTEEKAQTNCADLKKQGHQAGYLWIPDYASLSGAKLYSVYLGPYTTQYDCEVATEEYRKNHPEAYGLLVSQDNKRVQINGIGKVTVTNK